MGKNGRLPDELVREAALALHRDKVSSAVIARAFGIPRQRVAAWIAHDTMGTYGRSNGRGE